MLLKQLAATLPTFPELLVKAYEDSKSKGFESHRPHVNETELLLLHAIREVKGDIIFVIDALDEIPQPARKRMYEFFKQLLEPESDEPNVSLVVTSRWLADIKTHMSKPVRYRTQAPTFTIDIQESDTSADIVRYIDTEVDKAVEEEELLEGEITEDLIEDIKDHLQKGAGGMCVTLSLYRQN